jgi:ubiquitin carboxyl-terminal hydrolase 4/11/15
LVDFPIRNFNATPFCSDAKFLKDTLDVEPLYDLHGIVNHYGTLGFGHYVSFVRNSFDGKWYRYDDLSREEVSEDMLHKESAYLLFYVRKDLEGKSVADLMPNIEKEFFAGKPVKQQNQEGFIVENPATNGQRKVAVKFKN